MTKAKPFLKAELRWLVMTNYVIDPALLESRVPWGTELDVWQDECYVSVVGFLFLNTKVFGVTVPFHRDFEGVNLLFYVRRKTEEAWRRGVVLVKQIVPRRGIAGFARLLYHENYVAAPMSHSIESDGDGLRKDSTVEYHWGAGKQRARLFAKIAGTLRDLVPGTHEEFIAEHGWGYARQRNGSTKEFRVKHPPGQVWDTERSGIDADIATLYGADFSDTLSAPPRSAFVAKGTEVTVYRAQTFG